jgi:hypothetical protein
VTDFYGWPPEAWRTMPWLRFRAWSERRQRKQIVDRNAAWRAEWEQRIAEQRRKGG